MLTKSDREEIIAYFESGTNIKESSAYRKLRKEIKIIKERIFLSQDIEERKLRFDTELHPEKYLPRYFTI